MASLKFIHVRVLKRLDGFSKAETVTEWLPEIYISCYIEPNYSFNPDEPMFQPGKPARSYKIYFRFKEWLTPEVAVYEEIG